MSLTAVELFAGVGGFRLGLEGIPASGETGPFDVIWANQWEPSVGKQHAAEIYAHRWGLTQEENDEKIYSNGAKDSLVNKNIELVQTNDIPDHDLLCGGFPCQDYSVARTRSGEMGIKGEKGKLWTSIQRIISEKESKPRIVFLENVPRLLNSPASHRGLNFSVILNDLIGLGYAVEWRVINAADYGFPQKRKRIFIAAYLRDSISLPSSIDGINHWLGLPSNQTNGNLELEGPFSKAFPMIGKHSEKAEKFTLESLKNNKSPFENTGYAWEADDGSNLMVTVRTNANYSGGFMQLRDVVEKKHNPDYEVNDTEKLRKYRYIKGEQKEWRIRKADKEKAISINAGDGMTLWDLYQELTKEYNTDYWMESRSNKGYKLGVQEGIIYNYTAGKMAFPDSLLNPSRTVVTAEIGRSVSRMRHIIEYSEGKYRRLMPVELERLNGFPSDWTKVGGVSDSRRGFLMGNALVVGIVERLAEPLADLLRNGGGN